MRGELGEVIRSRVREDHTSAGEAGETDGSAAEAPVAHLLEYFNAAIRPATVRADRRNVERGEPLGGVARRNPGECLGLLVERHQGDDGQARGATHRLDGLDELVEVVERLDHEQVGAATLEHSCLLRERIASDAGRGRLSK